jgi:uncharacterized protein YjbI with pentapeptide repeats
MIKFTLWLFWDFSGLRFVWEKIRPPMDPTTNRRPPATIIIWILSAFLIYLALYGFASLRYGNRVNLIENRANAVLMQLTTPAFKNAIEKFPIIQRMKVPVMPKIRMPLSIFKSLFTSDVEYSAMIDIVKQYVEDWKDSLQEISLAGADLSNLDLKGAKLHKANLNGAVLKNSDLENAWLSHAFLKDADLFHAMLEKAAFFHANLQNTNLEQSLLRDAEMTEAILKGANLKWADLTNADLYRADFEGANLDNANLEGARLRDANFANSNLAGIKGLTLDSICKAKSIYHAKGLDADFEKQVKEKCPHLLDNPE